MIRCCKRRLLRPPTALLKSLLSECVGFLLIRSTASPCRGVLFLLNTIIETVVERQLPFAFFGFIIFFVI